MNVFKDNYKKIREHNVKFQKKEVQFELGVNEFADWVKKNI
jgi:hypothetical protein